MNIDQSKQNIIEDQPSENSIHQCQVYSELIRKLVNLGTHILDSIRSDQVSSHEKKGVVYAFFRRIIEMLDAAAVQLEAGVVLPVMNDLRTIIEAKLQLEYLYKDPTTIDKKVKYYLIVEIHNELIQYEKIKNEPQLWRMLLGGDAYIAELEAKILHPYFDDIRDDYTHTVTKDRNGIRERKTKLIKWYNINSNIGDFKALTIALLKFDYYLLLYGPSSNLTHSSGTVKDGYEIEEDKILIRKIRDKVALMTLVKPLIKVSIDAFELVGKSLLYENRGNYTLPCYF